MPGNEAFYSTRAGALAGKLGRGRGLCVPAEDTAIRSAR